MSEPIYNIFILRGFREAFYQLSAEEQERFWGRVGEIGQKSGAKMLVMCDARWCNEAYAGWGLEEYPDLLAIQKTTQANEENQHFRFLDTETILGTKLAGWEITLPDFSNPLYQLFLVKNHDNNAWEDLPKAERDRLFSQVGESIRSHGGVTVIGCDCDWSNEEYANFGINAWPSLEAEQAHFRDLEKIGWHRYIYARTILGTKHSA